MLEAPECPVRTCEWIQRSTDPRSNDMKILGGRGRGGQRIVKYLRESVMVVEMKMVNYIHNCNELGHLQLQQC